MKLAGFVRAIVFLFLPTCLSFAQNNQLISFELEDQFERVYRDEDFKGHIFILACSNAGGSKYNPHWTSAIYNQLKNDSIIHQIKWAGLADLGSVPFFIKGIVRNQFS